MFSFCACLIVLLFLALTLHTNTHIYITGVILQNTGDLKRAAECFQKLMIQNKVSRTGSRASFSSYLPLRKMSRTTIDLTDKKHVSTSSSNTQRDVTSALPALFNLANVQCLLEESKKAVGYV